MTSRLLLTVVSEKAGSREGLRKTFKSSGLDILCLWLDIYKRPLSHNQPSFLFNLDYSGINSELSGRSVQIFNTETGTKTWKVFHR